jgi:hypothetical protein
MKAIARSLVGLAAGCGAVVLVFDITGDLEPIRSLILMGCASFAIAASLFFLHDHRRKKRASL